MEATPDVVEIDPAEQAAMRQNFFRYLALPIMGVSLVLLVIGVVWANRVRKRKEQAGELPDWTPPEQEL
ncbi:MAG: hypothetical protein AAGK78_08070 [Planctomycetota bacterium]